MTLCIVRQPPRVLLGMKKRGFGAGRFNGFGGKVEPGESIADAARRELSEEAGIQAVSLERAGLLEFRFASKPGEVLEIHLFVTFDFKGEPTESEEMRPQWFAEDEIPFPQMWSDDIYWFPLMLAGKKFKAKFVFGDGDAVLEKEIHETREF